MCIRDRSGIGEKGGGLVEERPHGCIKGAEGNHLTDNGDPVLFALALVNVGQNVM